MPEKIDFEVDDFLNYCDYKGLAKKTIRSYDQTLKLFIRYLQDESSIIKTEQVKEQHIIDYIKSIKERGKYTVVANASTKRYNHPENRRDFGKKVSTETLNNYIRNLRVYFNYMYDHRLIKSNPMKKIKPTKTTRKAKEYIEDKDFNNLLDSFDLSKFHEYRDYIITQLIFDTGMRISETLLIKDASDINFTERMIFLPAENTKGKKDRYVFFSVAMATELRRWLQYRDRYTESEYLFCSVRGTPITERSFESNFTVYGERIGKPEISPHVLRNNFAKRYLMSDGNIFDLSKILGHSSVEVTQQCYADLTENDLSKKYQKHSPLMNLRAKRA